jgi:predicted dehydrogenase
MSKLTRRRFVSSTATGLIGASAVLSARTKASQSARNVTNAQGANERVRVAVIGCGGMGRAHINNFMAVPGTEIVAVSDVWGTNLERAVAMTTQQKTGAAKGIKDFRQILDMKDVDAVVVATPDHWHAIPLMLACQAGKDVYVEKPISVTIKEGRRMVDAARRYNRVVQVGTQQRSGAHYKEAVSLLREGKIGKIHRVAAWNHGNSSPFGIGKHPDGAPPADLDWDLWLGPAPKVAFNPSRFLGSFRWFWDYAGGQMTDWGVHHLDIINWVLGSDGPKAATAMGRRFNDDNGETPDTIEAVFDYPDTIVTYSHRSTNAYAPDGRDYGILFYGTAGTMFLNRSGYEIEAEMKPPDAPPAPTYIQDRRSYGGAAVPPWERPRRSREARFPAVVGDGSDQNLSHIRNFYDCLKSRQKPISDIEIGHHSSATAILGNIAYRTGRKIAWDSAKEEIVGDAEASKLLDRPYRAPWKT